MNLSFGECAMLILIWYAIKHVVPAMTNVLVNLIDLLVLGDDSRIRRKHRREDEQHRLEMEQMEQYWKLKCQQLTDEGEEKTQPIKAKKIGFTTE